MKKRTILLFPDTIKILEQMGEQIKLARLRRNLSVELVSERANISRATLWAIEKGSPSVAIGYYAAVLHALNDMVVAKGHFSKLAHLELKINGKHSGIYAADGLIVATATGSTAYSLSAGGPMVHPSLDVSIITPICAHALYTRPLIIPGNNLIEITAVPPYEELLLSADGEIASAVAENDIIRIDKNPEPVRLIRLNGRSYYETWQQKLMRTCGNEEAK